MIESPNEWFGSVLGEGQRLSGSNFWRWLLGLGSAVAGSCVVPFRFGVVEE
jgi:hypothetical protein